MARPVIRVNLDDETRSIPAILIQARGELKLWNIELDSMGLWKTIVVKNMSYNEAINLITNYASIEFNKHKQRKRKDQ